MSVFAAVVVLATVATSVASCAQGDDAAATEAFARSEYASGASDLSTTEDAVVARFETRFMEHMIDHHAMAIDVAQRCLTQAVHADILDLCRAIAGAQRREIATMRAWLASWYGVDDYAPRRTDAQRRMMDRLAVLKGAAFENEFLTMMSVHHGEVVAGASTCLNLAVHGPLLEMCTSIHDAQVDEILKMLRWRDQGFATAGCHASDAR